MTNTKAMSKVFWTPKKKTNFNFVALHNNPYYEL